MAAIGVGASLSVRQRRGAGFDFVGPALPAGATLARGSPASCIDATGLLAIRAANQPRFDSDPATRAPLGLLIEPAATNLLPVSEDMVAGSGWQPGIDGYWTASSPSAAGTPAGAGAALRLIPNGSGAVRAVRKTDLSFGGTVTASVHILVPSQSGIASWAVKTVAGESESGETPFLTVFDRWLRVACVIATIGTRTFLDFNIGFNGAFVAPAGVVVWLAKPQLEAGALATSYVATGAAATARAADVLTLAWAARGVADGVRTLRFGFDDGSAQDVATTIAGGVVTVPTDLRRPRLIRATLA